MAKGEVILVRVEEETKRRIAEAANRLGQSVTTFVTNAAEREAKRVESQERPVKGKHGGVPGFFRACCWEATRGGCSGYQNAAYQLARHLYHQSPHDIEEDEWAAEVEKLFPLLDREDVDAVWGWFHLHYPKCMKLVPARRKEQFVAGVLNAYRDEEIQF